MVQIQNFSRSIIRLVVPNKRPEGGRFSMNRDATIVIGDSADAREQGVPKPIVTMSDAEYEALGPLNIRMLDTMAVAGDIRVDRFGDPAPATHKPAEASKKAQ
jgi:hypothetical protein